ncbi:hypothetical protein I551_5206 [Mycobacterium ulcerans str. Harvey]|uniref:Prepilin-type N-terminal cleavage/methylation domain-containing protein n=1 Tax=Mycobacterium ulcerans str. Harvey TaxID=1299332 RepID=A0ABN0QUG8_MYCUL|nr:hypothetical protein I551_5206 [Mycobacterium ulcerans str. Harvey]
MVFRALNIVEVVFALVLAAIAVSGRRRCGLSWRSVSWSQR